MADNLLDKASILLTPTAYNDGSMLSIKPENGDGDFDFSRGSAATRVNAQGLVENVQVISNELVSNGDFSEIGTEEVLNGDFSQEGSELVVNGGFDTDSDWTKQASWSISGGAANYDFLSDSKYIRQTLLNGGFVAGKTYKINFEITSGTAYMNVNSNAGALISLNSYSVGSYSIYVTPSINASDLLFYGRNTSGTAFSIDNVSVKEVGQNWTLDTGWSIGDDKAICDGTQTGWSILQQNNILPSDGSIVKIVATVSNYSSGNLYIKAGFSDTGFEISSDGTFTTYRVVNGSSQFRLQADLNFTGSVTNISVKEVGQDWNTKDGQVLSADSTGLVFDNSNGNASGGIYQNLGLSDTKNYRMTATMQLLTASTNGVFTVFSSSANGTSQSGIHSGSTLVAGGDAVTETFEFSPASGDVSVQFTCDEANSTYKVSNVSVKEITDDTDIPRINYEGFSYQDNLGNEEVVNGDFSLSGDWTGQKTIANGQLTKDSTGLVYQTTLDVSVKNYKVVVDVDTAGTSLTIYLGGTQQSLSEGINTIDMQSGGSNSFVGFNNGDGSVINSISVKEVTGQEVVPDSGCGSWLLEPQSTNLVTYSEDFSQWSLISSSVTNDFLSPSGQNNAHRLLTTGGSGSYLYKAGVSVSSSTQYTASVYVKSNNNSLDNFRIYTSIGDSAEFNATSEWQRFEYTFTTSAASLNIGLRASATENSDILIWGFQLEQQSYVTSYIPTNGVANTRLADIANNSGNSTLINSTEGVLYAKFSATQEGYLSLNDGSSTNRIFLGFAPLSVYTQIRVGGNISADMITSAYPSNTILKAAIKYKANDFALWVNGVEVNTDNSGAIFTSGVLNNLSFNVGGGSSPFYGNTKEIAVYKEALTDAELQSLTTI